MASFQDDRGLNGDYHDRGSCMLCLEMEQLQKRKEEHQIWTGDGLLFTRNCKFCGGRLLYKNARVCEPHGQCCGPNGKYRAKLEEYEPRIFEPVPMNYRSRTTSAGNLLTPTITLSPSNYFIHNSRSANVCSLPLPRTTSRARTPTSRRLYSAWIGSQKASSMTTSSRAASTRKCLLIRRRK